jgi:hypothetical protein
MNEQLINYQKDKTIGVLSYLFPIGWIIAFILYNNKKAQTGEYELFHIRQGLGLQVLSIVLFIIGLFLPFYIDIIFRLAILAFVIIGLIGANNGEQKFLPGIGEFLHNIFKDVK